MENLIMMRTIFRRGYIIFLLPVFLFQACVEPYEIDEEVFEDFLVLETTITDEVKHQEIFLNRTYRLQENEPAPEINASVKITDGQNEFLFAEASPGHYISINEFGAAPGVPYILEILTENGDFYQSIPTASPSGNQIDNLYAKRIEYEGEDGVAIFLDNSGPSETSRFYKYEYEETYKIVSRLSANVDLIVENGELILICEKPREETVCYNTVDSDNIILTNSGSYSQNMVEGLMLRFIGRQDPVLSHRYSMMVKQYALTREAYTFFSTLKELSASESIFSQNQPGFINGNIFSPDNPEKKIIGYFNVASVSTKRMFFNFLDFYGPNELRADFSSDCTPFTPNLLLPDIRGDLIEQLKSGWVKLATGSCDEPIPYAFVTANCIDCNYWGSNIVPDFWED
ncbi:MAG TPA: DUF4249 domain-containing protein [Gillisia sp.]|nr:DUF4249 domain-containing protein [Gillisia sp.]